MRKKEQKPMCVTVIGWTFVIIGSLMFLSGSIDLLSFDRYGSVKLTNLTPTLKAAPAFFRSILDSYQQNFMAVTFLQVVFSGIMVGTGASFLRLHAWSRVILEVMTWLGLAYVAMVEVFYISSWAGFMSGPQVDGVSSAAVTFMFAGVGLGTAIWGVILYAILKTLRGDTVKAVLGGALENEDKICQY